MGDFAECLRAHLPAAGVVTVLELTEKQYADRLMLLNTRVDAPVEEEPVQLTLSF